MVNNTVCEGILGKWTKRRNQI